MPFVQVNVHNLIQEKLREDDKFKMYYINYRLKRNRIKPKSGTYRR